MPAVRRRRPENTKAENLPGCSVRLELVAKPCYESPGRTFLWERVGREGKGFGFEKDDLTKWMILGRWWYKRGKASSLIGFEDFFSQGVLIRSSVPPKSGRTQWGPASQITPDARTAVSTTHFHCHAGRESRGVS